MPSVNKESDNNLLIVRPTIEPLTKKTLTSQRKLFHCFNDVEV